MIKVTAAKGFFHQRSRIYGGSLNSGVMFENSPRRAPGPSSPRNPRSAMPDINQMHFCCCSYCRMIFSAPVLWVKSCRSAEISNGELVGDYGLIR